MSGARTARRILAGAAIAAAALAAAAVADSGSDAPTAPVRFVGGFAAGRAIAKERGVPLLVYVHSDDCPLCLTLDANVFAKPESGRLDAVCVAVKVEGGDAPAPDAAAFMVRYAVRGYPTFLVMDADSHVVVPAVGRTLAEMLEAVARVPAEEAALAQARRAADSGDVKPLLEQLWRRMAWEEFLQRAGPSAESDPATGGRVATALLRTGRTEEARAAWKRLAERYPQDEDRPEWLVRATMCDMDASAGRRAFQRHLVPTLGALRDLAGKAGERGDPLVAARAWIEVGRLEVSAGLDEGALSYFDKAIAAAPGSRFEPTALWERHSVQFRLRRYAEAKASCERIVKEFPSSPEAKLAPPAIATCDEMLGK